MIALPFSTLEDVERFLKRSLTASIDTVTPCSSPAHKPIPRCRGDHKGIPPIYLFRSRLKVKGRANIMDSEGDKETGSNKPEGSADEKQPTPQAGSQFDWLNWFYWSVWWQQYSYWAMFQQHSHQYGYPGMGPPPTTETNSGINAPQNSVPNQPFPYPRNLYGNVGPVHGAGGGGVHQPMRVNDGSIFVRLRVITGYEVYIAPLWKRALAEIIDLFLFSFLLKLYLPDVDFRVPEVLFHGRAVWSKLEEEQIVETQETMVLFLISVMLQRALHAFFEVVWVTVFAATPGKWLMGLRVLSCRSIHYTRTVPGVTVKIVPGGRLPLMLSVFRAVFKSSVSLFCPLMVFFISLKCGRTRYDEMFRSAVVDTRSLYTPLYAVRRNTQDTQTPPVQVQ